MGLSMSVGFISAAERSNRHGGRAATFKRATKNTDVRRTLHHRQQTLDSGYGSGTFFNADAKHDNPCEDHYHDPRAAQHDPVGAQKRQPQPYDGLLAPGEFVEESAAEIAAIAYSKICDRRSYFEGRPHDDWRNISVFYEDDQPDDLDETFASRYLFKQLCRVNSRTSTDDEEESGEELSRSRLNSLFGDASHST